MTTTRSTSTESGNNCAFSAIRVDGTVSLWGDLDYGYGGSGQYTRFPLDLKNIIQIYSNERGFYAIRKDGMVFADYLVGSGPNADISQILYKDVADKLVNIVAISTTRMNVAALTSSGAVIYFGSKDTSSVSVNPRLQKGVIKVFTTADAFAALKNDGSVVVWGIPYGAGNDGEVYGYLESGVVDIVSTGDKGHLEN